MAQLFSLGGSEHHTIYGTTKNPRSTKATSLRFVTDELEAGYAGIRSRRHRFDADQKSVAERTRRHSRVNALQLGDKIRDLQKETAFDFRRVTEDWSFPRQKQRRKSR